MNLRNLSIVVAILVALSGAVWLAQRPPAPVSADSRVGQSLLPTDIASKIAGVTVADQGRSTTLTRLPDGSWRVSSYHDFPADFSKLTRLINDLTEAKIQRLVTSRADRLGRLEFKDTGLVLRDESGGDLWQITLGKNADGGGRFLKFNDEQKGYLANLSAWIDAEPKNWADATILNLNPDDVAGVEIGFADGSLPVVTANRANKEDPWTSSNAPEGKRLKADRITSVLSNFSNLRFTDTAALDDDRVAAARANERQIRFTTFGGGSYTVAMGRKPEEKKPKATNAAIDPTPVPGDSAGEPAAPTADEPKAPEMETIPAGPVYARIASNDASAPINDLMTRRAFQIGDWIFTGLPATPADLWEDAPAPPMDPAFSATDSEVSATAAAESPKP